ncbi:MAG: ABC transporter permease [Syntrophaceae bacterium]|nr:ABC transporter permease [Syntrophaceae bacterium]
MRAYVIRRILVLIPTILMVTLIIFFLIRLIPGDLVDMIQAQSIDSAVDREALEEALGLDAPLIVQYGRWLGVVPQPDGKFRGLFQGDLGSSAWQKMPVTTLVSKKWPVTLELGIMGLLVSQLIALPIGMASALRRNTWVDYVGRTFAILCISVPGFWLGTMIIVFPALWWGYMPPIMLITFKQDIIGNLKMFIIPALVLGMAMSGMTMRMTRTMMLEVLRQDYIRTAWSKGLRERVITVRHALKNALIPVVTIIGFQVPVLIGGTVIVEQIFSLPGMGRLLVEASLKRDYWLISGIILIFSLGLVFVNLVIDVSYAYLDPRIHYR